MSEVSWIGGEGAEWLVTARPWQAGQPEVFGGVSFDTGLLHEPPELLGVTNLLAAWLLKELNRPVEAVDAGSGGSPAQVTASVSPLDFSLMATGSVDAVATILRRVDELLGRASEAEVDDDLRGRARLLDQNPLAPWRAHLVSRWAGHRPLLAVLGPLALPALDAPALERFTTSHLWPARRVYWTDDPSLPALAGTGAPVREPLLPPDRVAPEGWRAAPGCVLQRSDGELFSVAAPVTAAAIFALSVLQRSLHRRLVELEPLASEVWFTPHRLAPSIAFAGASADLLPAKAYAARAAVIQTLEDLAAGGVAAGEIERVQSAYLYGARRFQAYEPGAMLDLARRQLRRADRPTPQRRVDEYAAVTDEQVRAALAQLHPQLLLAVPRGEQALLPMAEPVELPKPEGRRYFHWVYGARWVRSSPQRLGIVSRDGGLRRSTLASVDFDEVVLRLDIGDQATTLVDRHLRVATVEWDLYRRSGRLREQVDRATAGVPVIREPPDPEWGERTARLVRRHRRRFAIGIAGYVIGGLGVLGVILGIIFDRPEGGDEPAVAETVDSAVTVTLPGGTTLGIVGGPELIAHYREGWPYTYAVEVQMCGGENGWRNQLNPTTFRLDIGDEPQSSVTGVPERPGPPSGLLDEGQCATGWLLYSVSARTLEQTPILHFANGSGDRAAWQLTPHPPRSSLSRPPA